MKIVLQASANSKTAQSILLVREEDARSSTVLTQRALVGVVNS